MMPDNPAYTHCSLCNEPINPSQPDNFGQVRGNIEGYLEEQFPLWKCPGCQAIHSLKPVDYNEIYSRYPLNERKLDIFARGTLKNLLKRLQKAGLKKTDRILDYGCGNGVMVKFLKQQEYKNVAGWDPYVPGWKERPNGTFDCVIANDVIEHVDDPRAMMKDALSLVNPGGLLYVGTADSEGVENMADLEKHIMRLHQPYHRVVLTQAGLMKLGEELGLEPLACWRRSYMDRLVPFSNYRFLDEFNRALGHNMNMALKPDAGKIMAKRPILWFWAFFGYFFPSAYEPAAVWRHQA
ncbi:MAG: hypothetical protein AXA67_07160 [Methylothermaceae bacteria B42]|nr:MAG: hypothetical protein AXA67_07160 [Methylothermaceae bacteria B42]